MTASALPTTGPEAIAHALANLDLDALEQQARQTLRDKKVSKRAAAVKTLNIIEGLRRNSLAPSDLLVKNVPVIPPVFRPFSIAGETFVPGDANELYKNLMNYRNVYRDTRKALGDDGAGDEALTVYDAVKALYGYGDPVDPKTRERGVSGFLKQVIGANPKTGWVQRRLLSKPLDNVARGVITVNPDLTLDEIGLPEEMAWNVYSPYIQRRLVRAGHNRLKAVEHIKNRHAAAKHALDQEIAERPLIYSRAPSWHRFNVISGRVKLVDGDAIQINPLVTTGLGGDFDGDTINIHVPSGPEAVQEAYDKLMPSKMVFSVRDQDKVIPVPKHEHILGLFAAQRRPAMARHVFQNDADARRAIRAGEISLADEIEIGQTNPQLPLSPAPAPQPLPANV